MGSFIKPVSTLGCRNSALIFVIQALFSQLGQNQIEMELEVPKFHWRVTPVKEEKGEAGLDRKSYQTIRQSGQSLCQLIDSSTVKTACRRNSALLGNSGKHQGTRFSFLRGNRETYLPPACPSLVEHCF